MAFSLCPPHLTSHPSLSPPAAAAAAAQNTLVIHNTCEDSLLAAPIILDLVLLAELVTRIELKKDGEPAFHGFHPIAVLLSYLTKAPLVPQVCGGLLGEGGREGGLEGGGARLPRVPPHRCAAVLLDQGAASTPGMGGCV